MKVIYLIGVSGSGKSTIGSELANRTGLTFIDGDDFHSQENKDKMASGEPLIDADREPWLRSINEYCQNNSGTVLACSALKAKYRKVLRQHVDCVFIHLYVERATLEKRLEQRKNHFMPCSLLDSQFEAWEDTKDEQDVLTIDCNILSVHEICDRIIQKI